MDDNKTEDQAQDPKPLSLDDIQNADERTLVDHASEMWRIVKETAREVNEHKQAMLAQAAQIKADLDAYIQAKRDQDAIALFLRNNYADEIKRGKHTGLTLSQVVIMYLSRERDLRNPFMKGETQ